MSKKLNFLDQVEGLYQKGFAIHLLQERSKRPLESKWTSGPRKTLEELRESYIEGMNIGVRLGETSKIDGGYLAVIDCDVKSEDPKHRKELESALARLFPAVSFETTPHVQSGRGNGSGHYYVVSDTPIAPRRLAQSADAVRVKMPSAKASKRDAEFLSDIELKSGYRMRAAWEISLMGEGQQVVLPPSIHPDTNRPYAWTIPIERKSPLPKIEDIGKVEKEDDLEKLLPFEFVEVDLVSGPLPSETVDLILSGGDCTDRSAALLQVAIAMVKHKYSKEEVLSVLSDPDTFLGQTGYDKQHCDTGDRGKVAQWVWNYTAAKAFREFHAASVFAEECETIVLTDEAAEIQAAELLTDKDWKEKIDRVKGSESPPKPSIKNIVRILVNAVSPELFKRDVFAYRDTYGVDAPWGVKAGAQITNDCEAQIRLWLSETYRFEPGKELIQDAITNITTRNAFHPVRDYLGGIEPWDGVERLDTFLPEYFEAKGNPDYLAQVFRKFMVGAVGRIYRPGGLAAAMPILEGPQGVGKSSLARILASEKWFLDWLPDLADKDSALGLQGIWMVEMGELASLRRNEVESVKGFTTRLTDKVRPPFGKRWVEAPRQSVFIGTTNAENYLRDDTGNRRFNPVKVGQLDFNSLIRDRNQLFAEAIFIYRNELEETLELVGDAKLYALELQKDKMILDEADLMVEKILDFIEKRKLLPEETPFDFSAFKMSALFDRSFGPLRDWKHDARNEQFAGKALRKMGGGKRGRNGQNFWRIPPENG